MRHTVGMRHGLPGNNLNPAADISQLDEVIEMVATCSRG